MSEKYKNIFIDWNGTLSTSSVFDHLKDPSHANSRLHKELDYTLNEVLWEDIAKPWMLGQISTEDIASAIASKTGISYDLVFSEIVEGSKNLQIDHEALEVVAQIREKGVKVMIATGNIDAFDRWTTPALGLESKFDGILNSNTIHALKKDRDEAGRSLFFRDFFEAHDMNPNECVIIDDMQDKEGIIESFGIKLIQLRPDNKLSDELRKILQNIG